MLRITLGNNQSLDFICHDLLIAKLIASGLPLSALKLVHNYLQNRKKEVRMVQHPIACEKVQHPIACDITPYSL